jgi:predicted nucleotidyltransferase
MPEERMLPLVRDQLPNLMSLCRKYRVQTLALFGSALRDDFVPQRSDLDFLVEFLPLSPVEHSRAYFGLLEELEALFGRPVDLVERPALRNPYIRDNIEQTQEILYAAA